MLSRTLLLISVLTLAYAADSFHPRSYAKQSATCSALNRHGGKGDPTETSITLSYVDLNPSANRTLLLVHGWPGLWSVWANQILHFQDKYRLIVPDLRGFGDSSHPGDVEASGTHADMVGDLVCILENAGTSKAVCIGHDWGSQICYEAARMRPDLFEAVIGAVVPYLPAAGNEMIPVEALYKALPKLSYQSHFEKRTPLAAAELNQDIRRTIRGTLRTIASKPPNAFLRSKTSFMKAYRHMDTIPPVPFFSPEEEDYYVEQYQKQGFDYTLQFYTYENRFRNWDIPHRQGNWTIPKPVLAIYPIVDPVADWPLISLIVGTNKYLPYLTTRAIVTAHWPHLEQPAVFNAIVEEWLDDLDVKLLEARIGETQKEIKVLKKELTSLKKDRKSLRSGKT